MINDNPYEKLKKKIGWFPPAEARLPWKALFYAFQKDKLESKEKLSSYLNVDYCVLGGSARVLLYNLLEKLKKINRRTEVLIPGYTCYSVAAAVAKAKLQIVVYDIDPKTFYPDLDSIIDLISEKTLAVVTQHLFGICSPLDEIKKITRQFGAYLIEDSAQALGNIGIENSRKFKFRGDFGLLSFGRGKPLPIGNGAALVAVGNSDIAKSIAFKRKEKEIKYIAITIAAQLMSNPFFYWIPEMLPLGLGITTFDPGFLDEGIAPIAEKIIKNMIENIENINSYRKKIAKLYRLYLPQEWQIETIEQSSSIIRFPVMLKKTKLKKKLVRLGVRRMYPNAIVNEISIQPFIKKCAVSHSTPGSIEIANNLFTLPTHSGIRTIIAKEICHCILNEEGYKNKHEKRRFNINF